MHHISFGNTCDVGNINVGNTDGIVNVGYPIRDIDDIETPICNIGCMNDIRNVCDVCGIESMTLTMMHTKTHEKTTNEHEESHRKNGNEDPWGPAYINKTKITCIYIYIYTYVREFDGLRHGIWEPLDFLYLILRCCRVTHGIYSVLISVPHACDSCGL